MGKTYRRDDVASKYKFRNKERRRENKWDKRPKDRRSEDRREA